jgi:hypothetical protein
VRSRRWRCDGICYRCTAKAISIEAVKAPSCQASSSRPNTIDSSRDWPRQAKAGPAPIVELLSVVHYHDEDRNAYNVLADLPGRDAATRRLGFTQSGR